MRRTTCETCGGPLKQRRQRRTARFCCLKCVPLSLRIEAAKRGREKFAKQQRIKRYRTELARLRALPKITADELTASFAAIESHGWTRGYAAADKKWHRRQGKAA